MGPTDAVPPVGAGNGGPDRRDVVPAGPPPMTLGRAALIAVLGRYVDLALAASPIEVQKLMYFLQRSASR